VTDEERALVRELVIREAFALGIMAAVLWYMGPGKIIIGGWLHRAHVLMHVNEGRIDHEVARFRAEVSRWDHEQQAAQPDNRPGGSGPCGC
jgi:hypothetical protein